VSWAPPPSYLPTLIGEGYEGSGASAANIKVMLGDRNGPVGAAWATALATPTAGHEPFIVVARPGLPVKPWTLFVNTVAIAGDDHGTLTVGAAHAGVAAGIIEAVGVGVLPPEPAESAVLIASVWVDPAASPVHQDVIFVNNRVATVAAVRSAMVGGPTLREVMSDTGGVWNAAYHPS